MQLCHLHSKEATSEVARTKDASSFTWFLSKCCGYVVVTWNSVPILSLIYSNYVLTLESRWNFVMCIILYIVLPCMCQLCTVSPWIMLLHSALFCHKSWWEKNANCCSIWIHKCMTILQKYTSYKTRWPSACCYVPVPLVCLIFSLFDL